MISSMHTSGAGRSVSDKPNSSTDSPWNPNEAIYSVLGCSEDPHRMETLATPVIAGYYYCRASHVQQRSYSPGNISSFLFESARSGAARRSRNHPWLLHGSG